MNYNLDKNYSVSIEKIGLDTNGNMVKRLTFYKKIAGVMQKYKTKKTNESLDGLTADRIIEVWG